MRFICMLFIPLWVLATPLQTLLQEDNYLLKATIAKSKASYLEKLGIVDREIEVDALLAYADSDHNGYEKEFSISFNLFHEDFYTYLKKSREIQELQKNIVRNKIDLLLWKNYALACILQQQQNLLLELDRRSRSILTYTNRLLEAGEIGMKRLYYLKAKRHRLRLALAKLDASLQKLRSDISSVVEFDGVFECPVGLPSLNGESLRIELYKSSIKNLKLLYKTMEPYKKIRASIGYEKELDTKRVRAGFTMPLGLSEGYKAKRARLLAQINALSYEMEAMKRAMIKQKKSLQSRLKILDTPKSDIDIKIFQQGIEKGEETLLDLITAMIANIESVLADNEIERERTQILFSYLLTYDIKEQR